MIIMVMPLPYFSLYKLFTFHSHFFSKKIATFAASFVGATVIWAFGFGHRCDVPN